MIGIKSKLKTKDYGLWTIISISVFLSLFFLGFILATSNIVYAQGPCSIKSAEFEPFGNLDRTELKDQGKWHGDDQWYDDDDRAQGEPEVKVKIETENCGGEQLMIQIVEINGGPESFVFPEAVKDKVDDKTQVIIGVPEDKPTIELKFLAGEENCNSLKNPDCYYYLRIFGPDFGEYSPPVWKTRLQYNCELLGLLCEDDWEFKGPTDLIQKGVSKTGCKIISAKFNPSGSQPDEPKWYNDNNKPFVNVTVTTTKECAGETLKIQIKSDRIRGAENLKGLVNDYFVKAIIPDDGIVEVQLRAGEKLCRQGALPTDCQYHILASIERLGESYTTKKPIGYKEDGDLSYECDTFVFGCFEYWVVTQVLKGVLVTPEGVIISVPPKAERDWYCKTGEQKYDGPFDTKEKCEAKCPKDGECLRPYRLLEPLPGIGPFIDTTTTGFVGYLSLMFQLAIGIAGVLAVIMLVIGGIEYMATGSITEKGNAKKRIGGAIGGLLLALAAFMILNTINPDLVDFKLFKIETVTIATIDAPMEFIDGKTCIDTTGSGGGYTKGEEWAIATLERNYRLQLKSILTFGGLKLNVNVSTAVVTNTVCLKVGDTGCTSVTKGSNKISTTYLEAIRKDCGTKCELTITGATECWLHGEFGTQKTTHRPGSPTIDLRTATKLDDFLKGQIVEAGGAKSKDKVELNKLYKPTIGGTTVPIIYEENHWHIGY